MSKFGSPFGVPFHLPFGQRLGDFADFLFGRHHANPTGFDTTFNSEELVYSSGRRIVTRTDDLGRRAVRSRQAHNGGKRYFELMPFGARLRFVGVVDGVFDVVGAGGPAGHHRVGLQADELVSFGAPPTPYGFATPGTIVRVAIDLDAERLWLRLGSSYWNHNPMSDPAGGVLGLATGGLAGATYAGATLRPVSGAGARLRTPDDSGFSIPPGFTEWGL